MRCFKRIAGISLLLLGNSLCLQAQSKEKAPTGIYTVVRKSTYVFKDRISGKRIYVATTPDINVSNIEKVSSELDVNGLPALIMKMDAGGKEKLTAFTTRMKGKQAAIIVNNKLLMAPTITSPISGGRLSIRGGFTLAEVNDLKNSLQKEIDSVKQLRVPARPLQ